MGVQPYRLTDDFVDEQLESTLLKALSEQPELYWELIDTLPEQAFVTYRSVFVQLAQTIEQSLPLPDLPEDWKASEQPAQSAAQLADLLQRRLLASVQEKLAEALYSEDYPAKELALLLEEEATRVQTAVRELRVGQMTSVSHLFEDVLKMVRHSWDSVQAGNRTIGISCGMPGVDRLLGGFQTGLHLLAAQPGMGKTTMTLQWCTHVARSGTPVVFVSFEESLERLTLKAICQIHGLESKRFIEGYGNPDELHLAMASSVEELGALYLLEGSMKLTVAQVKARALSAMARHDADRCLIVIDYLQRWASGKKGFSEFRHVVSTLVSELRELSLRLNSPVLAISSQNRPGQGKANLSSLKESGDLEYSADSAMFLVEAEERHVGPGCRPVDLVLAKNRFGDRGQVSLVFKPAVGVLHEEER
jgi:replicative DNA helicase